MEGGNKWKLEVCGKGLKENNVSSGSYGLKKCPRRNLELRRFEMFLLLRVDIMRRELCIRLCGGLLIHSILHFSAMRLIL